ncbi:hypothetical protein [Natronosalvus halobius]|uniref:hypothetical protein n=1 Tax=Natronosalvus halobius TaxID=2953746 RepID=UPI00209E749E|nr:hypothetical protein [Natronosalvus halobius]USZ71590.1 hypothetical protein NGM15_16240 [Natronosalvus halobius]
MNAPPSGTDANRFFDGRGGPVALGLSYVAVGIALFYALATDSIELVTAVLVGVLGLLLLSLYIVVRREGLVTAENRLIGTFVLVAMGLLYGLYEFTSLSSEAVFGIVFVVGVIVPHLLLEYTDYGTSR